MQLLPCLEIEPHKDSNPIANAAIIWLHGLGADGYDFKPIIPQLNLSEDLAVRFVFPHAPNMPVTVNGGFPMPAWYDIKDATIEGRQDLGGIKASAARIQQLIDREVERGISPSRIILAGFSQGGALAVYTGIHQQQPLAGILGLSCYTLLPDEQKHIPAATKQTPVLLAHGKYDDVVDFSLGETSYQLLSQAGFAVEFQSFEMAHTVSDEEITVIADWIARCLK